MPKRSKNSTDGAVFTYYERRNMDHGSTHLRLPDAALKPWDCCALGLAPPTNPVITPHGVLYEREAVLRDLLRQREENRRREEQVAVDLVDEEAKKEADRLAAEKDAVDQFEKCQELAVSEVTEVSGVERVVQKKISGVESNFWLPSVRNKSKDGGGKGKDSGKRSKKSFRPLCPISKKPLRTRDLISLKLTPLKMGSMDRENGIILPTTGKYMCPVCQTALVNAVKPVALRTGTVLCSHCVSKFVLKDKTDPITSTTIDVESDVIPIFNVGTVFAASAADDPSSREATLYRPSAR